MDIINQIFMTILVFVGALVASKNQVAPTIFYMSAAILLAITRLWD